MKKVFCLVILILFSLCVIIVNADELEIFREFYGEGGYFGWSLCGADLNADGFPDLVAGAPMYSGSIGSSQGRVYVFFGGPSMDTIPDLILDGTMVREQFGIAVSNAGDLNGDGADDLIVGGNVTSDIGGAYIFYGGSLLDEHPDVVMMGEERVDNYGYSVTGVGDINDDGYSDVLVGALYNDERGPRTGRAYLYFGGEDMDSLPDLIFTGRDSLDDFACHVDGNYDFNNDGYPDIFAGAVQAGWASSFVPDSLVRPGEAILFFGGPELLDNIEDIVVNGENPMDFFGGTVTGIQDFNNDGYDDFAVGAYHYSGIDTVAGRAYIYLGGTSPSTEPFLYLNGYLVNETFGDVVADPGDINGDGYGDLAVGASINRATEEHTGLIYIFYGGSVPDTITDIILTGEGEGDRFGWSLESLGDINGDGLPDIAVSAPNNDEAGLNMGKVYVYLGFASGPPRAEIIQPFEGAITSCPDQAVYLLLTPQGQIDTSSIEFQVNEELYRISDSELSYEDSMLIFTPSFNFDDEDSVFFCLNNLSSITGISIPYPLCSYFRVDLSPPQIEECWPASGATWFGRQPEFRYRLTDNLSGVDFTSIMVSYATETAVWGDSSLFLDGEWLVFSPIAEGFNLVHNDSFQVCLELLQDSPDYCDPNQNTDLPFCNYIKVNLYWQAELIFEQAGLNPTRLIIGQYQLASDSYDIGIDIPLIPPPPNTRTDARLICNDPEFPHIIWLNNDYRDINDTNIIWKIYTIGDQPAMMQWDPEAFPEGLFILQDHLDMKANSHYFYNQGDTISIQFNWRPLKRFDLVLLAGWNLISLPICPREYDISELFSFSPSNIYVYNPDINSYQTPDRYPSPHGFFLFSNNDTTISFIGAPLYNYTIDLKRGWNHIGSIWDTSGFILENAVVDPEGSIFPNSLFYFNPLTGYIASDFINMGYGYWILCRERCTFQIN
ncbi:FG-GAP repeat protein, partial [bacterium]|nr:FG-GAP repeat protein [bacterium]